MTSPSSLLRLHLLLGWAGLFLFALLGIGLESFHALKLELYLHPAHETRRLLFRLAHAHGSFLALVHIAFAASLSRLPASTQLPALRLASASLFAAGLLLPGGFFLGGLQAHEGDPGSGILLVPAGAVFLLTGLGVTAWCSWQAFSQESETGD